MDGRDRINNIAFPITIARSAVVFKGNEYSRNKIWVWFGANKRYWFEFQVNKNSQLDRMKSQSKAFEELTRGYFEFIFLYQKDCQFWNKHFKYPNQLGCNKQREWQAHNGLLFWHPSKENRSYPKQPNLFIGSELFFHLNGHLQAQQHKHNKRLLILQTARY